MAIGGFGGFLGNLGAVAGGAQQYNIRDAAYQQALAQLAQQQRREQALAAIGGALGSGGQDIQNLFGQPIPKAALAPQAPLSPPIASGFAPGTAAMRPGGSLTPPVPGSGAAGLPAPSQAGTAVSALAAGQPQAATAMQPGSTDDLTQRVLQNMMRQANPVQIAQAIKSARPSIDDATLATATQMLMQMTQSTVKADQVYALGLLREIGRERGQDITRRGQDIRSADTERGQDIRAGTAERGQDITRRGQDMRAGTAAQALAQRQQQFTIRERRLAAGGKTQLLTPQEQISYRRLKQQMQALNNQAAAAGGWVAADESLQNQARVLQDEMDQILSAAETRQGGSAVRPPAPPSASQPGGAPLPPPQ